MQEHPSVSRSTQLGQPLDRTAILLILILGMLIGLLLLTGDHSAPKVRDFSWQERVVGAEDTAFVLTFSRPMDQASVEANLQIGPPLPGRISWAGRRMAYTLDRPAPYGNQYQIELKNAQDRFAASQQVRMLPFTEQFRTRDRAFAYIGVDGKEAGRLILYNLTRQQKHVLTPANLVVADFKAYPGGWQILFAATERNRSQGPLEQKLYRVTTGLPSPTREDTPAQLLPFWSQPAVSEPGQLQLVLDNKDYQNLKFDLSADGQTIVVQRVKRKRPGEFGLWVIKPDTAPQPLPSQPGGDFLITPDGQAIVMAQGEGLAILPLNAATKPLDFLPQFGRILSFSRDGAHAAVVKFNQGDYTRSLFLVDTQGTQKELLKTTGSILSAQFDPTGKALYCLLTQLLPGKLYRERPYLATIDLENAKVVPLLLLPEQREVEVSLSPDGLALLFDQVLTTPVNPAKTDSKAAAAPLTTAGGKPIETSRLWLLPLPPAWNRTSVPVIQPEPLPLPGLQPSWLP